MAVSGKRAGEVVLLRAGEERRDGLSKTLCTVDMNPPPAMTTRPSTWAERLSAAFTARLASLLLLLALVADVQAQFLYSTNDGRITITRYYGSGGVVIIPNTIIGLPVTSIGSESFKNKGVTTVMIPNTVRSIGYRAFAWCGSLTSATIPNGVIHIGEQAFLNCSSLTSVTIGDGVMNLGDHTFYLCTSLRNVTIGNSVTNIGSCTFMQCTSLTSVTIPHSVTTIGADAFGWCRSLTNVTLPGSVTTIRSSAFTWCTNLTAVCFEGDSPDLGQSVFDGADSATVYYLPGTTGWDTRYGDRPTAYWVRPNPVILSHGPNFGVQPEGLGFTISWATNDIPVAIEACADLISRTWSTAGTKRLTGGTAYFIDADWVSYPARFYRVRSQ